MKRLQLAINYGMGVPSLARGLDRHPIIAGIIIDRHRRTYPTFWKWRAEMVQRAMLDRRVESTYGWPLRISFAPNKRTLYNFPMQAGGADMLRIAVVRMCEAGIVPVMLVHDAVLLELDNEEQIEIVKEIMKSAGRDVCNGLAVGADVDQRLMHGARYADKRPQAIKLWGSVMETLARVKAIPTQEIVADGDALPRRQAR
jgi:DNA polymerase I-like protein with 3'-5' exonuclease and polymerase domains